MPRVSRKKSFLNFGERENFFLKIMAREIFLGALAALLVCAMATAAAATHEETVVALATTDAYEKIESYGFPQGILPHTIVGYKLEAATGRFTLYLEGECKVLIQHKYPLEYDRVITGLLSYGELQDLKGIRVKVFYVWWSITAISRGSDDSLSFVVGILSAKFPLESFDDPPICESKLSQDDDDNEEEESSSEGSAMALKLNQELLSLENMMHHHHHQQQEGFLQ